VEKLGTFQALFGIQYSSADLKVTFDTREDFVSASLPPRLSSEQRRVL
jgi:hypothetical protein